MWLIGKKNYKELDDKQLILLFRSKNDQKAVAALFERYSHLVFGVCMKYLKNEDDSKDATLTIFEKLQADLKRFDIEQFSFWIHRVAKNHCLMQLRSRKTMISIDDDEGPGADYWIHNGAEHTKNESLEKEEHLLLLEEAITQLNVEQKICIELFYLKKYCYQDVAEIAGFSLNEVKSHIQNGKRNLKIYMTKRNHELSKL
jgi:RNA polymerase sigma factor (sigma-70 family)